MKIKMKIKMKMKMKNSEMNQSRFHFDLHSFFSPFREIEDEKMLSLGQKVFIAKVSSSRKKRYTYNCGNHSD